MKNHGKDPKTMWVLGIFMTFPYSTPMAFNGFIQQGQSTTTP